MLVISQVTLRETACLLVIETDTVSDVDVREARQIVVMCLCDRHLRNIDCVVSKIFKNKGRNLGQKEFAKFDCSAIRMQIYSIYLLLSSIIFESVRCYSVNMFKSIK